MTLQPLIDEDGNKSDVLEAHFAPFEEDFKNIIRQIENTRDISRKGQMLIT